MMGVFAATGVPGGMPNMYFWNVRSGEKLKEFLQKKQSHW